jgi:hypothetical protein
MFTPHHVDQQPNDTPVNKGQAIEGTLIRRLIAPSPASRRLATLELESPRASTATPSSAEAYVVSLAPMGTDGRDLCQYQHVINSFMRH